MFVIFGTLEGANGGMAASLRLSLFHVQIWAPIQYKDVVLPV